MPRDEFAEHVKRALAHRVGNLCSAPTCRAPMSGPQIDPAAFLNVGVAAHITAASPGGPRFDPLLSPEQRSHAENGIWLCQTCAKLVDNDAARFHAELLRGWKGKAEAEALRLVGKTRVSDSARSVARTPAIVKSELALKKRIRKDFLKSGKEYSWKPGDRPYAALRHGEVIVRKLEDTSYPGIDEAPGISGWFKAEVWGFYHNGFEIIVHPSGGAVERTGRWFIQDGMATVPAEFTKVTIPQLGQVPWRNIVDYDLDGDEYYPFPHIYCRYADDGEPYEAFRYLLVASDFTQELDPTKRVMALEPERTKQPKATAG